MPSSARDARRAACRRRVRAACEALNLPLDACVVALACSERAHERWAREDDDARARGERVGEDGIERETDAVAAACVFLACKLEEAVIGMGDVAHACAREGAADAVARRERGVERARAMEERARGERLAGYVDDEPGVISGGLYYEYKDLVLELERDVLRAMNFELNVEKPHGLALHLVRTIDGGKELARSALAALVDTLFELEGAMTGAVELPTLAAAAVRYASKELKCEHELRRSKDGREWWDALGFDSAAMHDVEALVRQSVEQRRDDIKNVSTH